jgi:hypothetical protein
VRISARCLARIGEPPHQRPVRIATRKRTIDELLPGPLNPGSAPRPTASGAQRPRSCSTSEASCSALRPSPSHQAGDRAPERERLGGLLDCSAATFPPPSVRPARPSFPRTRGALLRHSLYSATATAKRRSERFRSTCQPAPRPTEPHQRPAARPSPRLRHKHR